MNLNPAELLNPIFNTLDSLIENYGVYLYLVFVWLALLAIAWIFSGGLRKRMKGNSATVIPGIIFTMQPPTQSRRQSSASRLTRRGTVTTKQWTNHDNFSLPTIRPWPMLLAKMRTATRSISRHELHHQIARSCSRSAKNSSATVFKSRCNRTSLDCNFIQNKPYPLSGQGFYGSPIARRKLRGVPRDGHAMAAKHPARQSGEISRVMSAQRPGNGRTVATAMPPDGRRDDSQDNLPCAGFGRAMSAPETCETTRNLAAQQPRPHISQAARGNSPSVLTMTSKNYEHTNHTNARS